MLCVLMVGAGGCSSTSGPSFGSPVAGQHVYDRAGILTSDQILDLEARAAEIERAGAPIVVYLRLRDASFDETLQDAQEDAQDLMAAWNVESAPGAHDGIVIALNFKPDDKRHGEAALYAGQKLVDGGRLPQYELQRIYDQVMQTRLHAEDMAGGIAAGLDAIQHDLINGAPPAPQPTPAQQVAIFLTGLPLLALSLLLALLTAILALRARRPRPPLPPTGTTTPPGDLAPALVGALVSGRVGDNQMVATLLDLARRGILAIEPAGKRKAQMHLLEAGSPREGYEEELYRQVRDSADVAGIVSPGRLGRLRTKWGRAEDALKRELVACGWYDPSVSRRRSPLYLTASAALVLSIVGFLVAVILQAPFSLIGTLVLFASSIVAYSIGASIPNTSAAGEEVAMPWRSHMEALKRAGREAALGADLPALLDAAVPYALASGSIKSLGKLLKEARKQGYAPLWLGLHRETAPYDDYYPVWTAFVAATAPSGGDGGVGAAAGGAGAGGGF